MGWSVWACDTVSGDKLARLPGLSAFSWGRALSGSAGSKTAKIQVNDKTVRKLGQTLLADLTDLVSRTLVLEWDGVVKYAGIIWESDYDQSSGVLTISHEDIWSLIRARLAVNHYESDAILWKETYPNLTLRQFTKLLMVLGLSGPPTANMMLPITLPADEVGAISRTVYGYHLPSLIEMLEDVMAENGGPNIDFQPRWVAGKLNWLMRVGSAADPKLTGTLREYNLSALKPDVAQLRVRKSGQKLTTNIIATGEGSGTGLKARSQFVASPSIPYLERVVPYRDVSDLTFLQSLAVGGNATYSNPTVQWSMSVVASVAPTVGPIEPGDVVRVHVSGDMVIADGVHNNQLIEMSGDLGDLVRFEFQPTGGV